MFMSTSQTILSTFLVGLCMLATCPVIVSGRSLPTGPTGTWLPARTAVDSNAAKTAEGTTASAAASVPAEGIDFGRVVEDVVNGATQDEQQHEGDAPSSPPTEPPSCTFFLVRHGQSKANVAGKIVSGMEGGMDPANGLTEEGLEQARAAGRELKEVMLKAGCLPANTMILTSPFSRAKETAEAIRECLDCELREERDLHERWFGDLDGREDAAGYSKVWALDSVSARHGELRVESASKVAARVIAVVKRAQKEVSIRQRFHTGDGQPFPPGPSAVILVSHGDALQLLQCALAGRPLEQHRSLPHLENCGIRALRPPPENGGVRDAETEKLGDGNAGDGGRGGRVGPAAEEEVASNKEGVDNLPGHVVRTTETLGDSL